MKIKSKKQKFYIKNVYVNQMLKPQKQNSQNNVYCENSKNIPDNNISQSINFNPKKIFFNKKTIKTLYQSCYPNKSNIIKGKQNFGSQKNIHNKSCKKFIDKPKTLSIITDTNINLSNRKFNQKSYEIINPFKERCNSENKINCFNRTYTFFNNKEEDTTSNIKIKQNDKKKQTRKTVEKITINLNDIGYQKLSNKFTNYKINKNNSFNNRNEISPIQSKNNKKYFYQDNNQKNNLGEEKNNSYSEKHKKAINTMTPLIRKNFSNANIASPINNNKLKIKNENGRIKKYILNNLSDKRKIRSRQCFRQYLPPLSRSSGVKNENLIIYDNYFINNSPRRKKLGNKNKEKASILNSPSIPSLSSNIDDNINSININKKCLWIKKNKQNNLLYKNKDYGSRNSGYKKMNSKASENNIDLQKDLNSNISLEDLNNIEKKEIKEKVFEQSAIMIQSYFRGYIVKNKFETFLYNFKNYNINFEYLIKIFTSFLDRRINLIEEKKKFFNYLLLFLQTQNFFRNNSFINFKSCKTFKLTNLPSSPASEKERHVNHFVDLFLHKEIGERFNIIKQNKEKEIEQKYKEELEGVNSKMNKLIEENNKLKDINNKNKYQESKFKELSLDNKKKDNIINIITNDNQNLARKLKIIKDKYNKLEIHKQDNLIYNSDNSLYIRNKELLKQYRNLYLLFLIHKKNAYLLYILRKTFNQFRSIVTSIKNNKNKHDLLKLQKLKYLINNKTIKEYNIAKNKFKQFYFKGIINNKEILNKDNILKKILTNLVINKEKSNKAIMKSYFNKFYYKGKICSLIEENNKYIKDKNKENNEKIKNTIISIDHRKDKHNFLIVRDCFDKWNLFSKILGMKAITDEKKRKKRQKQRMKKKIENKSANKYLTNNNHILHLGKNNNINIINKEKDKDILLCSEHSATTDFSGVETNRDNKNGKIVKATQKLGEIFYKAAINYKKINIKKDNINKNNELKSNKTEQQTDKKDVKENYANNENDNEEDEDSGDSFGI